MLNVYFEGMLDTRSESGYSDGMSLTDKLKIMRQRLLSIKNMLVERNQDLPFEVEPRRVQSKLSSYSVSLETPASKVSSVVMATPASSFATAVIRHGRTTPRSSFTNHGRRMQRSDLFSGNKEECAKRHKLDVSLA